MDTASSKCPENQNSTDCLLRALLNVFAEQKQAQDAGIDWDPITFGVTLLIGLVASSIALATVFQAVLAGGKGGRRANSRAIGRWSKHTTRKWIFSEMDWSYTAYTPVLRLGSLERQCYNAMESLKDKGEENSREEELERLAAMRQSTFSSHHETGNLKGNISEVAPYPATWLGLLHTTGLKDFDDFDLTPTTADYLPDDFIAVPASAEVGAIMTITAAAGVQQVAAGTDVYPLIIGYDFEFDFRQHPVLGIIGAFSAYGRIKDKPIALTPSPEMLAEAVMHSRGIIEPWHNTRPNLRTRETGSDWKLQSLIKHFPPIHKGRNCFIPDYDILDQNQIYIASFISAKSPKFAPSIFPSPVWRGHNPFKAIALSGRFWSKVRLRDFEEPNWEQWPDLSLFRENSIGHHFLWLEVPLHALDETVDSQIGFDVRNLGLSPHGYDYKVISLCLNLLNNPRELQVKMSRLPFEERERLREAAHILLGRTDNWLMSSGSNGAHVIFRIQRLLYTSIVLSKAESMTHDGLFEVSHTRKSNPKQTEQQQQKPPPTVRGFHFKMLEALRGLIGSFDLGQKSLEAALKIEPEIWQVCDDLADLRHHLRNEFVTISRSQTDFQVTLADEKFQNDFEEELRVSRSQMRSLMGPRCDLRSNFFNTHQILNRLATVVGCHSDSENRDRQNEKPDKIDDVLIFRSLIIGTLFLTACNNSKVLESGVWDRVVPII